MTETAPFLLDKVRTIVAYEAAGRWVAAAVGLAVLRRELENTDPRDLPPDERDWADFTRKHFPFSPQRLNELIGAMVHRGGLLRCRKCRAAATCACGCGEPYLPERWKPLPVTAHERALAAVSAHPDRSNRALAAEIGCDHKTIAKARRALADSPPDSPRS